MSTTFPKFNRLFIAIALTFEDKYLTYFNPSTRDFSVFLCDVIEDKFGDFSYEEVLQQVCLLLDRSLDLPNHFFIETNKIQIIDLSVNKSGNAFVCAVFSPTMDTEESLSIHRKPSSKGLVSFYGLEEFTDLMKKDRITSHLMPLLTS